jgi:hypothetical protein
MQYVALTPNEEQPSAHGALVPVPDTRFVLRNKDVIKWWTACQAVV